MKKNLLVILIIGLIVILLVGGSLFLRSRKAKEPSPTLKPEGVLIETTLEERPFISLTPSSDGHWLTLEITRIREADSLEYELLYNTATGATQGSINTVNLKGESSYTKKILLGSESSGHYKFDEGVTQGSLTVRLRGGKGTRKFITEFHLQKDDKELASIDGNFTTTGAFPKNIFYLIMPTIGLPGDFSGKVNLGPYGIFTSGAKTVKNGQVTLNLGEALTSPKIYSWTGRKWEEEKAQIKDKIVSANIASLATFIVSE